MSESEFAEYLQEVFEWTKNEDGVVDTTQSFESAGLMTSNEGLVVTLETGEEFQITIVKSR